MNSINNILSRLRESRINEDSQSYEYKFDIPWRCTLVAEEGIVDEIYDVAQMDYGPEIMETAKEDWNESNMAQYARKDPRTSDLGITKMTMDFNDEFRCIITVTSTLNLTQEDVDNIISWLTGQMSDGWGEGFEQREVASYEVEDEEWDEDEEDYIDVVTTIEVLGQFWWTNRSNHPWEIYFIGGPASKGISEGYTGEPSNFDPKSGKSYHDKPKDWEEKHEWVKSKLESAGYKCKGQSSWGSIWNKDISDLRANPQDIKIDYWDDLDVIQEIVMTIITNEDIEEGTTYKRIASTDEFDNGRVMHNWSEMSNEEAEELAKQKSIESPDKIFYVAYDDVMNPSSDIKWKNGVKVDHLGNPMKESVEDTTRDFIQLMKDYNNYEKFDDKDKESGRIRDLIDKFDEDNISYYIYNHKINNGCTIFY